MTCTIIILTIVIYSIAGYVALHKCFKTCGINVVQHCT